ncbi:MAG: sigma-70 family RNA polymerase sigma factor [Bacteroidia bacterium]|nr:sigma-70 family RNA polymerase sigma factor [Bacteroidia bacterium]MCF8427011.1 sigma-70 family RNA polymerase sigma factor [Bacteroidia bacterium]
MSSEISDKELIQQFRLASLKQRAFEQLLKRYSRKIYWQVRRIVISHDDADDVVQNTFIKVWEKLEDFREDSQFYTWLYRVATNEALAFLQKKKADRNISMEELQESLGEQLVADAYFNGNQASLILQKAILSLPEKQRLVFNMKYFDNMKYDEMEAVLGTSVGALKASYHHAVKKIELIVKESLNHSNFGSSN